MASNRNSSGQFKPGTHWRKPQKFREKEYLLEEYREKKRSTQEIADEFGVTDGAILHWLHKHGIPRRNTSEASAVKRWALKGSMNGMYGKFGKESSNYKGGISPERQAVYSRSFWKQIVSLVRERDDEKCVRCATEENLGSHHLKSWAAHPEARYDIAQIVTICKKCHNWIHSKRNKEYEFLSSRRHSG